MASSIETIEQIKFNMEQNTHSNLGKLGMNNRIWKSKSGSCSQFREVKKEWLDIATVISSLCNKKKYKKTKKKKKQLS